ncbi:response regulator [Micromonospora sp. NPDC051296]|uniref:response regulator n=1 Tax=Micromonospora sp. NPDC051296 TaxID=3155046 RepID=UPI0034384060
MSISDAGEQTDGRPVVVTALIAHPDESERAALRAVLDSGERMRVVAVAGDGGEAMALAHRLHPAVTLLDDQVTTPDGQDLVATLARRSRVIILTGATAPRAITSLLRRPVRGCLVYGQFDAADLLGAVRAVAAGLGWLSPVAVAAASWQLRNRAGAAVTLDPPARGHHTSSSALSRNPRAARRA